MSGKIFYIIGSSGLTISRVQTALDHGAFPVVFTLFDDDVKHVKLQDTTVSQLKELDESQKIKWIQSERFDLSSLTKYGREEVGGFPDAIFVTLPKSQSRKSLLLQTLYDKSVRSRIPINVADSPDKCSFTLLSTYRKGDFQLGVTTSGTGCRLANRIKREATKLLPLNIDDICGKVGELRKRIIAEDEVEDGLIIGNDQVPRKRQRRGSTLAEKEEDDETGQDDDDAAQSKKFNTLVLEHDETYEQKKKQRLRWLSQVVEYYPLSKLADISVDELSREYRVYRDQNNTTTEAEALASPQESELPKKGRISLIGAGPGSSDLLTTAALKAITEADVILSDKLVPEAVLSQIPRSTPVHIAKKFPGNAERAQQEFLDLGVKYMQEGKYVVRLKQGDPYIFGRGAEEFIHFAAQGYKFSQNDIIPGITSALSAPLAARIPPTHRDVADQVLICTGTGRRGALPNFPEWVASRTCVFLMSLHRIADVVNSLVNDKGWDDNVPVCVIERASCPDQRIIRTRLKHVVEAIEKAGSRPPGLLVTGYACEVIEKLDENEKWRVEEGIQ